MGGTTSRTKGTTSERSNMTNKKQIAALRLTIKWFKKQIKPRDCGWMYTTIDGLKYRIKELRKKKPSFEESFFANRKAENER